VWVLGIREQPRFNATFGADVVNRFGSMTGDDKRISDSQGRQYVTGRAASGNDGKRAASHHDRLEGRPTRLAGSVVATD
jgi:hypothetical protein